jgi:hypothetical protein
MQNAASEPPLTCFAAELRVANFFLLEIAHGKNPTTTNGIRFMVNLDVC